MIESIDTLIQILATAVSSFISFRHAFRTRKREWIMLGLASSVYLLGGLYWQLYMIFYGKTPHYSDISYVGWYASYLFLFLLLSDVEHGSKAVCRYKVLWLSPVFAVGMGIFYIAQSGWSYFVDSMMNMIVMSLLLRHTIGGILYLRKDPASAARKRWLYILILAVCIGEYGTSVVSCFWMGDTLKNPYFWFDFLLSLAYLLLPAALKKAVK